MTNSTPLLEAPRTAPTVPAHGAGQDPRWTRPALYTLLLATAVTYLWNLGASGYANTYYAAAVQAGTQNWKAWLFGSLDSANLITVDKPPAALWVMALSGRIFGFSSWSMLVPQALMGVASVALLFATVRRWSGPRVALAAAAVLAFTPVAVLMFRFNNPDALLVLLMVAAAYTCVRAVEVASTKWLLLTGVLIGFGFLTKMLQVMLVLPALAGVYLLVADTPPRRRIAQLLGAGVAMVVSAGWYVALVAFWPAADRPYIGGSQGNSLLELALGYNGLSRIFGGAGNGGGSAPSGDGGMGGPPPGTDGGGGPGGGGPGGGGFGGSTGITRMFNDSFGGNISWLLPAGLLVLVAGLWLTRRAPRTDRTRAGLVLWGGWLVVTGLVFSFMSGTVHPYYAVAMAPALAGCLAVGVGALWRARAHWAARATLALAVAGTAAWSTVLLLRDSTFLPWLHWVVPVAGGLGALALLLPVARRRRGVLVFAVVAALLGGFGGATAYAAQTALTAHHGSIVSAGPSSGGFPGAGPGGARADGTRTDGARSDGTRTDGARDGGGGGPEESADNPALTTLLRDAGTRWSAAAGSAQGAAGLELSSGTR